MLISFIDFIFAKYSLVKLAVIRVSAKLDCFFGGFCVTAT